MSKGLKALDKKTRGFDSLYFASIAKERYSKIAKVNLTKANPKTIWETFDFLSSHFEIKGITVQRPYHLRPYIEALQSIKDGSPQKFVFHAPPRHSKTFSSMTALLYYVLTWPNKHHGYITYSQDRAESVMAEFINDFLLATGTAFTKKGRKLFFKNGSSIHFDSSDGTITGETFNGVFLVDDIVKMDMTSVGSSNLMERIWTSFNQGILTRDTGNLSVVVMMTRWNPQDLSGRLITERGYPYIRLSAICDSADDPLGRKLGEALWPDSPDKMNEEFFKKKEREVGDTVFAAMYQGLPSVGRNPFKGEWRVDFFTEQEKKDSSISYGIDLSHGVNDPIVFIRIRHLGERFLIDHFQIQNNINYLDFVEVMAPMLSEEPGTIYFDGSQPESAMANSMNARLAELGLSSRIRFQQTSLNKLQRAQDVALAFSEGSITIDNDLSKTSEGRRLMSGILAYDGHPRSPYNDMVDALSSAWKAFATIEKKIRAVRTRRYGKSIEEMKKSIINPFRKGSIASKSNLNQRGLGFIQRSERTRQDAF